MFSFVRRVATVFLVIGVYYNAHWTIAVLMSWFAICVEGIGSAVLKQGNTIVKIAERVDQLVRENEEQNYRRRSA
jgi:hypothetical protein